IRRQTTSAHPQAAAMDSDRPGPAATDPALRWAAREIPGVGWSTFGALGWPTTLQMVALPFAATPAARSTPAGLSALLTTPRRRSAIASAANSTAAEMTTS